MLEFPSFSLEFARTPVIVLRMCFSATASFSAAVLTGVVGIATLNRTRRIRDIPLACFPLLFSAQQAIEGLLWLGLRSDPQGPTNLILARVFTSIALVLWPAIGPLALGLAERGKYARLIIYALIPAGLISAGYSILLLTRDSYVPTIANASISYVNHTPYPLGGLIAYVLCTCVPPLLSTDRFIQLAGTAIVIGFAVSSVFFYEEFFSVWCFFAALASIAIFGSFQRRSVLAGATA